MEAAAEKARAVPIQPSAEMFVEALSLGIKNAEQRRRESEDDRE